jgi:hypothetical protein
MPIDGCARCALSPGERCQRQERAGRVSAMDFGLAALHDLVGVTTGAKPRNAPLSLSFSRRPQHRPTVSLGATYVQAYTYGCGDGRIVPTRCAVIDAAPGDRWSRCQACRIPPAGASSAHSALAAGSRPVSTADPDGFPRLRTRLRSGSTPCDDASLARCARCAVKARYRNVETPSDIQVSDEPLELSSPGHLGG